MNVTDKAALQSNFRGLGRRIQNCRHGGPSESDQETPWFKETVQLSMWDPTPIDWLMSFEESCTEDEEIKTVLISTISFIINNFNLCLSNIGSRKLFTSMAIDAWFNEDFFWVRKFMVTSIILYHLQKAGLEQIFQELDQNTQNRESLLKQVKGVLWCHEQGLKAYLEFFTDGSCSCINLAQALNEEKETIFYQNSDDRSTVMAKKQWEEDRLPPVLKESSKYWKLKVRAAECLKKKKMEYATKLYLKAKSMLEENKSSLGDLIHEKEWHLKIEEEIGKVASNLSMIYLMEDQKGKALEFADEAVRACPGWSKSHCRRALALKSLDQLDEAQVSIFNAIQRCQREILMAEVTKKQLKEYQNIKTEIEAELDSTKKKHTTLWTNPLCKTLSCKFGENEAGNLIWSIHANQDLMDVVYSFLAPVDIARLECTCLRFAVNPEHGRRIAISTKLLFAKRSRAAALPPCGSEDVGDLVDIEHSFAKYASSVNENPMMALRKLLSDVHHLIADDTWNEYITTVKIDPMSLDTILATAFPTTSENAAKELMQMLNYDFESSHDFAIAKFILRGDHNLSRSFRFTIIATMTHLIDEDEDDNLFSRRFVQNALDIDIMRLAVSLENDDDNGGGDLRNMAFVLLQNSTYARASRKRKNMAPDHPIFRLSMAFHSLYTKRIPDNWPGVGDSLLWSGDLIEKEVIERCWTNASMFGMWRASFFESLKWVRDVEMEGCMFDYLLVGRLLMCEFLDREHSPINSFSFGAFLAIKAAECGGAVFLSSKLKSSYDFTDFFHDYYNFLRTFCSGFPALRRFSDSMVARHFSSMGYD